MKQVIIWLLCVQSLYAQDKEAVLPTANLVTDGIPAIPLSIKKEVQRYSESRAAGFVCWHPLQMSMIINTRFGNVAQLHQVKMPMGARTQLTFFEDAVTDAIYEPTSGKYFLFTMDEGGNEFTQIFRYDTETETISIITDGGRSQNGGIVWNHAGNKIAYSSTRRNGADRDVYIMDPENPSFEKPAFTLTGGGWGVVEWSPDDKKLLLRELKSANESHLWIADIESGNQSPVTDINEKNVYYGDAAFNKSGKGLYVVTDKDNEFKRLAFLDLVTNKMKYISDIPWDVQQCRMSDDKSKIAFVTNEAGESQLYLLETLDNKYKPAPGLPQGIYSGVTFHHDNTHLAISINSARSATDVFVLDVNSGNTERWTESELGGMVANQLSIPSLIKWKSFDGREISGFYYRAASKFTGKRPVVINIHGGPEGQSRPIFIGAANYFLNEMGVAILFPNVRGSDGFGKTFIALDNGMKREESVRDIGALLDWIQTQPELDASRIMVTGGSYGGYMTLAVSTNYSDRIKCALDVVGISHFGTFLKNTESYRRDLRRVEYGDERDSAMSAFFEKISPLNNAAKIKKPLFIVQGGNDPRVPRTEALQMAGKVKANGGEIWYLEAKDEGHGFRKKSNADFQRYATILFMKKFLLDGL
jgi:dipeptidyl aminopeptidase/acylaminoacyl peptidase